MARPMLTSMAFAVSMVLTVVTLTGCGGQAIPTSAPPGAVATMTDLPSPTSAASVAPTVAPADTPTIAPTLVPTPSSPVVGTPTIRPTSARAPIPTSGTMQIKLFFVAINDNGKSGKKIGCDDSLVTVNRPIPSTSTPLTAAYKELLGLRDQNYGQSGLYNALYQSSLKFAGASISDAKATVNLTGTLKLGGVCDNPRVAAQLEQVALQFATVQQVVILVNGVPLDKLLSEK